MVFAHLLAPSAAARTRAEVHRSSKRDAPPFHPLVVFKRGRTGSTWFADLLTNEPAVAFFAHEAQYCLKSCAARYHGERRMLRRALGAILSTPTCEMDCNPHAHGAPTCDARRVAWAKGRVVDHYRGPPPCVRNRIVGFDANPTRAPFSHNDWIAVLRLPRVAPVVYARTNAVKMAVCRAACLIIARWPDGSYHSHRSTAQVPRALQGPRAVLPDAQGRQREADGLLQGAQGQAAPEV